MTAEQYFQERDAFVRYVEEQVNPARKAEGLDTVSAGAASQLYSVIHEKRHLEPILT